MRGTRQQGVDRVWYLTGCNHGVQETINNEMVDDDGELYGKVGRRYRTEQRRQGPWRKKAKY